MDLKNVVKVDSNNFEKVVSENKLLIVDFWAEWCSPCKMLIPVLEELASKNPNVVIGKLNVDENAELARKFNIRGIPTLFIYKDGELKEKVTGYKDLEALTELINNV